MAVISKTNKGIPDDMLLGNLLFMSIADVEMGETELTKIFDDNGLDKNLIRRIFASDVFRRVTSSYKNESCTVMDTQKNEVLGASIVIDETNNTDEKIVRVASVKLIDKNNEVSEYIPFLRIVFDKQTETLSVNDRSMVQELNNEIFTTDWRYDISIPMNRIVSTIQNEYSYLRVTHDRDTIRNIIKRVVDSMQPVALMQSSGICKFIPIKYKDTLYGLKNALVDMNRFASTGKNSVEIIPLIDTDEQRLNILESVEHETKEQLLKLTMDLKELLNKKNKLSTRSANAYIQRFKELRQKSEDYQTLVNSYNNVILQQIDNMLILVDNSVNQDAS